jgi:hypothetical protein
MAISLTIHNSYQINGPFGRIQKQTDQNQTDFIIIEDVDGTGIVQSAANYTNSPLFLKVLEDGTYTQVNQLPFATQVIAVHRDLDNLKGYMKDSQTFVVTFSGNNQSSVAEYAFGNSNDDLYLEIDLINETITAYA